MTYGEDIPADSLCGKEHVAVMGSGIASHSLTIVIPALNEEQAIGGTITRCLAAREQIKEAAGLDDVEIIVVHQEGRWLIRGVSYERRGA